jgi:hypothetical protein
MTCSGYGPPPRQRWRWLLVTWWRLRNAAVGLLRRVR